MRKIKERFTAPTPKIWRKIRNGMIAIGAIGGTLLTLPVSLPAGILTVAGYAVATGAIGATWAQLQRDKPKKDQD